MAQGDELLIVDGRANDREGMKKMFEQLGYVCTTATDARQVQELVERKFFPAALVDLDVGRPGAGIDVIRSMRERSRQTAIVLTTGRRSFEAAVEALRLGVVDVIVKRPEEVERLKQAVAIACDRYRAEDGDGELIRDVQGVLGDAFRIVLDLGRNQYQDISVGSGAASPVFKPRILVVDGDQAFLQELAGLVQTKAWDIAAEMNGGGALDRAGDHRFDLVVCREELMDLRGSMVVKTIQAQRAETVGLVYSAPGPNGHVDLYREGQLEEATRPFASAQHLIARIEAAIASLGETARDRRIIQAFRAAHEDFFRRFAQLKMRIDRLLE
jgi:DNA-binding NtrC family response regulator